MCRSSDQYGQLTVHGEFDPDAVTEQLGVAPARINRAGDPTPTAGLRDVRSIWEWRTPTRSGPFADDVALEVLDQFESRADALTRLVEPELSGATLSIVVRMAVPSDHPGNDLSPAPTLIFSPDILARMAALPVTLAILPYVYVSDELPDDNDPLDPPSE
ncbi:DUF4279 domain-containing protein [Micropruina sonneratiae]|uniref:DUF4279 domain-containing protein n=1 Tax=Micropruina sonneratiae TaxID=2986940 RepID=UPI0022275868|nr:DUF4279 domain-containing protein [Micropruina sp. KQZ13P-5]MCW3157394.1 DUF4279 domain-containing protein [Micropruina sp. KQZ13P-5]